jgi:hypothetical protein
VIEVLSSEGPANPEFRQPIGTRSQMIEYWESAGDHLVKIAIAHRYVRPDGTIGASGRPDPKRVVVNGVMYKPRHRPGRSSDPS